MNFNKLTGGAWFNRNSWPDPIPFDDHSNLPVFPVEALPEIGRDFVQSLSEVAQVDSGLAGVGYLATISACLGGKITVNLGSHKEPVNIFLGAILPSGHRKSSVFSEISRPIYQYQTDDQEKMSAVIRKATTKKEIMSERLVRLQKKAASEEKLNKRLGFQTECEVLSDEIAANPIPTPPVYICDDITTEALGSLMTENSERMAIISAEGGIFKLIGGLYSKEKNGNFDLYLKAHAGDPWSSHRVGRKSENMASPALTMGSAIQPDVIEELGKNKEFRGRGD